MLLLPSSSSSSRLLLSRSSLRFLSTSLPTLSDRYVPEGGWSKDATPFDNSSKQGKTYGGVAAAEGGSRPGQTIRLSETPPVSELLTNPQKPLPSYRSPTAHVYVPPTIEPVNQEGGEGEGEVVEEVDPWRKYVPPRTMPRRDLVAEAKIRMAEKKAREHRESWSGLMPPMAMMFVYILGTYSALKTWRASLTGEKELIAELARVQEKRLELEQVLLERDKRLAGYGFVKSGWLGGSGSGEQGSGKSWWRW